MRLHPYLVLAALILIDLKYTVISETYVVTVKGMFFKSSIDLVEEIVYPLANVEYQLEGRLTQMNLREVYIKLAESKHHKLEATKEVSFIVQGIATYVQL